VQERGGGGAAKMCLPHAPDRRLGAHGLDVEDLTGSGVNRDLRDMTLGTLSWDAR
jgi:hypothetical protein